MKIIKLQSENIKRLKAIEIIPKDNVVIISGKNEQGKSSILDSIELALKASNFNKPGKQIPMPIRDGEEKAQVIVELDDYIVTRNWTANDKSYLKVENKEGAAFKSPQALIDSFLGDLSFDPLQFARLRPSEQKEMLIRFIDLDIDLRELEEQKKQIYDDRTLKGRELKTVQARTANFSDDSTLPDTEIDPSKLSAHISQATTSNIKLEGAIASAKALEDKIADYALQVKSIQDQAKLALANLTDIKQFIADTPKVDLDPLLERLHTADDINARIRQRNEDKLRVKHAADLQFQYDTLSKKIEKLDRAKDNALSSARMPISGLGIDDDGITFNGKPFSQVGGANQLKVSLAIAMSMNPTLKVIRITDGSLLDKENLDIIKKMAQDNDYQCWIEVVEKDGKVGFTLEDGEVVAIDGAPIIKEKIIEE